MPYLKIYLACLTHYKLLFQLPLVSECLLEVELALIGEADQVRDIFTKALLEEKQFFWWLKKILTAIIYVGVDDG